MSEVAEMFRDLKKISQEKKANNEKNSLNILKQNGIEYKVLNEASKHYRVMDFDYWPSTGKFYNQKTGEKGRGIFNLIKRIN